MSVIVKELETGKHLEGRFVEIYGGRVVLWPEIGVYKGTGRTYGRGRRQEALDYSRVEVIVDDLAEANASDECCIGLMVNGNIVEKFVVPKKPYHGKSLRLTKNQFRELVKESREVSLRALVRKYNVSHETMRNYLRKHGIPTNRYRKVSAVEVHGA